jgi:exonuclease SbcD
MSLKILHTSDWHLGKIFKETNFDLLPIQELILKEIEKIVEKEKPQIILIAGDVFDTYNPSFKAEKIFYETITSIAKNSFVLVIAGNHDSPEKLQIPKPLIIGKHSILIVNNLIEENFDIFENDEFKISFEDKFIKVKLKEFDKIVAIKAIPYLSEVRMGLSGEDFLKELKEIISAEPKFTCDYFIFVSHLFIKGAQKSGSERIIQIGEIVETPYEFLPKNANYIALGHLHKYQVIGNAIYSGSIYPFEIHEVEHKKGVCFWEENNFHFIEFSNIPKIKRLEFETIEDAIKFSPDDQSFYFIVIKSLREYFPSQIEKLFKKYKDKLINWRFETEEIKETEKLVDVLKLSDAELFKEFYKFKYNKEPDEKILKIFLECLEEARNASS